MAKFFNNQDEHGRESRRRRRALPQPVKTGDSKSLPDLITLAKSDPKGFVEKAEKAISEGKLRLADMNLRDMQRGFKDIAIPDVRVQDPDGQQRAISASAFPLLTGLMVVAEINEGLAETASIGGELVTDFDDTKKVTVIDRVITLDTNVKRVDDGVGEYPEIGASEESYEVLSKHNGRKLSIAQALIDESDTPNIIERVNKLVEIMDSFTEEETLQAVCDQAGNGLRKRGSAAAALFSATANTPGTRAPLGNLVASNALASTASLDTARARLASFLTDRLKRSGIEWSRQVLLVPDALIGMAWKLTSSELQPGKANEVSSWGPRGPFRPRVLSSPKLDDISTSDWFMGDFAAQFRRKWKLRSEIVTLGMDTQRYLDSRIAFQMRIALDVGTNPVDYNRVVKNTA